MTWEWPKIRPDPGSGTLQVTVAPPLSSFVIRHSIMTSHIIHLRDPWQCERASEGGVRWSRAFHRPTGLTERETVWLVITDKSAVIELNGHVLAAAEGVPVGRYDITDRLLARNHLVIQVPHPSDVRTFDVAMEITTG